MKLGILSKSSTLILEVITLLISVSFLTILWQNGSEGLLIKDSQRNVLTNTLSQTDSPGSSSGSEFAKANNIKDSFSKLPMSFEVNEGQTSNKVKFIARGNGYALFLTETEAVFSFFNKPLQSYTHEAQDEGNENRITQHVLRMKWLGANLTPRIEGIENLPGKSNYFTRTDQNIRRADIKNYAKVCYKDVYPGIDLVFYGNQGQLEYDFIVSPYSDPDQIKLSLEGASQLKINDNGDLVFLIDGQKVEQNKLVAYQGTEKEKRFVRSRYVLTHYHQLAFKVGEYDKTQTLVIDPVLSYATFLGGSGNDFGKGIAVDASGSAYVMGFTRSAAFPTTSGTFRPLSLGGVDVFITKLDASGSSLIYSTYLGGTADDWGNSIAIDSSGNAYIAGYTFSTDFPATAGAFQSTKPGIASGFVTKLNSTGSALTYSTYLGGNFFDAANAIALDISGNAYVTGRADSNDFPTTVGAFQSSSPDISDAFVTKLNPTGSALVYSTYLGGSSYEEAYDIRVDSSNNAYVVGRVASANYPVTAGAFQTTIHGSDDAFITKLNSAGSALLFSTYLGGGGLEDLMRLAIDSSGNSYIAGTTDSNDFPITAGAFQTSKAVGRDAFVAKLNSSGSALSYGTYLGGGMDDFTSGIALDASGGAYVTGFTSSTNFPTTPGTFLPNYNNYNSYITKLNPLGSALVYSTYYPGATQAIKLDSSGNAFVTGTTSTDFLTTPGAYQTSSDGLDAFVSKINASGSAQIYSSYLGGTGYDEGIDVAVDAAGSAYITGTTASADFPIVGASLKSYNAGGEVYVAKMNATGTALVYSTFLGGSGSDSGGGIFIDSGGNTYVTGFTSSADFPTTVGAYNRASSGGIDIFVAKLNPTGSALLYSTYVGGAGSDAGSDIFVDSAGNAYITGSTSSANYPTTSGVVQTTNRGGDDAFLLKLNANGSALVFSTYIGGGGTDIGFGLIADSTGNAFLVGRTISSDFPTTPGALQTSLGGSTDVFVVKVNPTGSAYLYSTYMGGTSSEEGRGIAVAPSGTAYVTGYTASNNFPTTPGAFKTTFGGGRDAFAARLNASGTGLLYSTYIGGSNFDEGRAIAIDNAGKAYLTGYTASTNFPITPGAIQTSPGGSNDAFLLCLDAAGSAVTYSTYLAGLWRRKDSVSHLILLAMRISRG